MARRAQKYMSVENRELLYAGNHCDHCVITFMGVNWFIHLVRGPYVYAHDGVERVVIDMSQVDWPEYHAMCVKLLEDLYGPL